MPIYYHLYIKHFLKQHQLWTNIAHNVLEYQESQENLDALVHPEPMMCENLFVNPRCGLNIQ